MSSRSRRSVRRRAVGALVLAVLPLIVGTACGGETTKEEFVAHAIEFTAIAKTPEDKAMYRRLYECMWPEISKDPELLDEFMAADTSTAELSQRVSRLMAPCVGELSGGADAGAESTTTAPAAPETTGTTGTTG